MRLQSRTRPDLNASRLNVDLFATPESGRRDLNPGPQRPECSMPKGLDGALHAGAVREVEFSADANDALIAELGDVDSAEVAPGDGSCVREVLALVH